MKRFHYSTLFAALVEQTAAACCYATSDKYGITDPAGAVWETLQTLGAMRLFGHGTDIARATGCCG